MNRIITTLVFAVLVGTQLYAQNVKQPDSYNYNRGVECLRDEREADAYEYFEKEVKENPKNGYAYAWLGYILLDNELYGDALSMLEKAEKYVPSKDRKLTGIVFQMKGDVYDAIEEYDKALVYYSKAIKVNPEDKECYRSRAEFYYKRKEYALSDKDFDKIIQLDPSGVTGYMGKGRNANLLKHYDVAIGLFDQVVKLHGKDYSQCYAFRAEAYAGLGEYEKAADDIITASLMDGNDKAFYLLSTIMADSASTTMIAKLKIQHLKEPNAAHWPYYIGIVYEANKNYDKAIDYYKKSNIINASDIANSRVSQCYFEKGDFQNALLYIDKAIQLDPSYEAYRLNKADIEYDAGMIDEALADISSCIASSPEYFGYYYRKGFYEDNAGMIDEAVEDYSAAILLNPEYYYSYLGRGDMYLKKGMIKEAMDDYRSVVRMDTVPSDGSCAQYAFLALGENDKAIEFNQRILDSFPNDNGCWYDAACLYARMGEYEQSLEYLRTAFEKGYRRFAHVEHDDDFDALREKEEYKALLAEFRVKAADEMPTESSDKEEVAVEIPFIKTNGVTEVQCSINGLPLHFVFDTGASDVTISMVEATFMLKNKYLSPLDVVGKQNYLTADGNISEGTVINLKSVKIGDLELTSVRASVVKTQSAPLLLGQSVLGRLGKIEIDNEKSVIRVTHKE